MVLWEGDGCAGVVHVFLACGWRLHFEKVLPIHMETDLAFEDGNAEHKGTSQKEA